MQQPTKIPCKFVFYEMYGSGYIDCLEMLSLTDNQLSTLREEVNILNRQIEWLITGEAGDECYHDLEDKLKIFAVTNRVPYNGERVTQRSYYELESGAVLF